MDRAKRWRLTNLALCAVALACSDAKDEAPAGGTSGGQGGSGGMQAPIDAAAGSSGAASGGSGGTSVTAGTGSGGVGGALLDGSIDADGSVDEPGEDVRCADVVAAQLSGETTPYPGGKWTVPEASYGTSIDYDVQITMSDGVVLIGDVSYPTDLGSGQRSTEEFPVLLTQNPYTSAAFGPEFGALFVTHGYIFASVDVRGTGRSPGTHDLFSPREAEDGAELVEWASQLAGADGRVGLQGCSQLGINQIETATLLGPDSPVKAMIPACGSGDFYRDTAFDNGIATVAGSFLAAPDTETGGDRAYYRDYWKERDRLARAPAIAEADIPALFWSGWFEPGAPGSLELYTALQNLAAGRPQTAEIRGGDSVSGRYQVILGDWGHAGGLDQGIELQWFDTWIKGIDTGLQTDTTTPLHLTELGGTKRWVNAKCYPLVESYTPLYLASGGELAATAEETEGSDELTWVAPGETSEIIEYTSEPFAEGVMLAGPIAARLHVSSSNGNAQLVIDLFDRAPDGELAPISHASILGALRRTDDEKSWIDDEGLPVRPYLTLDEDEPLTPGEAAQLDVPLWPSVWSIEPGHAIVVRIGTQPISDQCLNPIALPVGCFPTNPMVDSLEGGAYTLHHGGELRSLISLPLLSHGALPTAKTAGSPTGPADLPLPIEW